MLTGTEQQRLEMTVRAARVGIIDWDRNSPQTYYSPRFRELRGYAPDADTSRWPESIGDMLHPEEREEMAALWMAMLERHDTGKPQSRRIAFSFAMRSKTVSPASCGRQFSPSKVLSR